MSIISDFCPNCGFTDFKIKFAPRARDGAKQIILECVKCSFTKSYPPPYPPNWEELNLTMKELVETTNAYGLAMFRVMESGICPHCHSKLPPEDKRIEILEDEEFGLTFPEENIKCKKCGVNYGWASFMKLMEAFHPVREFLRNHPSFRIETDGEEYEIYGKKVWKISFVEDQRLDVYFDIEAFEPIWLEANFNPIRKTTF